MAMRLASGPAFHHPIVTLPLQNIAHVHSGSRRIAAFGLKMYRGCCFIVAVDDVGDADVHRKQIGTLGKIGQNALAHRIRVLDVAFAADKA